MRYFIAFSYFGQAYHGWQRQPNATTVQQTMEEAMSTLLRQTVSLVGAGRTDSGVHARAMYAHFDLEETPLPGDLVFRLNAFLPEDIAVKAVWQVSDEAHARFDALERSYEYRINSFKDPFLKDTAYYLREPLDLQEMNKAAALLLEESNFESFSKSNTDVKTYICDVRQAAWTWEGEVLVFKITADRFLRNMVRAVVGTLLEVGSGKKTVEDVKTIIKSRDRRLAGVSVPAKGLSLVHIVYPDDIFSAYGQGDR